MKKGIIISLLSFATLNVFAQTNDQPVTVNNAACRTAPEMPANAVPAWPQSAYTTTQDPACPPCYRYKTKHGLMVMECPFLTFLPEGNNVATGAPVTVQTDAGGNLDVLGQNTYAGYYPAACKRDPEMPANATPVWPKSEYIPLGNPACAPCYQYTTKHGLNVMECHHLWFPPDDKK